MTDVLGKMQSMLTEIGSAMIVPAMELEDVSKQLGVMMGSSADGSALASSLQRLATNGVVGMQELQSAAAALIGSFDDPGQIAQWVARFADISAGSKLSASRLAEMVARLDDMGKAEFTELANAGIPIYQTLAEVMGKSVEEVVKLGAEGKVSAEDLLAAFEALTNEGGKFHDLNAEMSSTTAGSWETLKASVQEVLAASGQVLTSVVRPILQTLATLIQKYKVVFTFLVGAVTKFVLIWGGLKLLGIASIFWNSFKALMAMNGAAQGLRAVLKSIGRIGWIALISGAVEAFIALYNRFYGAAEGGEQSSEWEEARDRHAEELAQTRANAVQETDEARERVREIELKLANASNLKEFADAEKELAEEMKKLRKAYDNAGIDRVEREARYGAWQNAAEVSERRNTYRERAVQREQEAARREVSLKLMEEYSENVYKRSVQSLKKHFGEMNTAGQKQMLAYWLTEAGVHTSATEKSITSGLDMAEWWAAEDGNATMAEQVKDWRELYAIMQKTLEKEKKLAESREAAIAAEQSSALRAKLEEAGDTQALAAFDDAASRERYRREFLEAGMSEQEAQYYATQRVQRERSAQEAATVNDSSPSFITSSTAAVGGGGFGIRLGDAQLDVSKKHLAVGEQVRDLVQAIGRKISGYSGIPVTA